MPIMRCVIDIINLRRKNLLSRSVHLLSSPIIRKPINNYSYLTTSIPVNDSIIIAFNDKIHLENLKEKMQHPYEISSVKIADIIYYIKESNSSLMIIEDIINCDDYIKQYNTIVLKDSFSKNDHIPVSIEYLIDHK